MQGLKVWGTARGLKFGSSGGYFYMPRKIGQANKGLSQGMTNLNNRKASCKKGGEKLLVQPEVAVTSHL